MATEPYMLKEMGIQALMSGMKKLWEDDESKDMTIISGEDKIMVHKAILSSRSDFFKAACAKGTFKEGQENVIDLSADDEGAPRNHPSPVSLMVEYLYTLSYDVKTITERNSVRPSTQEDRSLTVHTMLIMIADKYNIPSLLALARYNIEMGLRLAGVSRSEQDLISTMNLACHDGAPEALQELQGPIKDYMKYKHKFEDSEDGVSTAMLSAGSMMKDILVELREEMYYQYHSHSCHEASEAASEDGSSADSPIA